MQQFQQGAVAELVGIRRVGFVEEGFDFSDRKDESRQSSRDPWYFDAVRRIDRDAPLRAQPREEAPCAKGVHLAAERQRKSIHLSGVVKVLLVLPDMDPFDLLRMAESQGEGPDGESPQEPTAISRGQRRASRMRSLSQYRSMSGAIGTSISRSVRRRMGATGLRAPRARDLSRAFFGGMATSSVVERCRFQPFHEDHLP